ncbi:hypothetical protein [Paenibacillus monticola]|uniref:Uncharacterized protein n=1 Tax=Paenibacillus monticola TaxID=2666075 RepID=A0A7X2H9N7_9BACL|nr:hypothetical protein [Paenibacillus monticola]MRN55428.1 hypothetical protein [Paenibacillus monticola]
MKKVFAVVSSLMIVSGLFGAVGASAAPVAPTVAVDQAENLVTPFANPDVAVNGGYGYARYYASGGRVDVELHSFFLNPQDARVYATKSEPNLWEGIAWFAVSCIPYAGNYIGGLGLLSQIQDAAFVSSIRRYADVNQSVEVTIVKDTAYGITTRSAQYWNGMRDTVQAPLPGNPAYLISSYAQVKY